MIELFFVRHGQTDSNLRRAYLGWTDAQLNCEGIKQAEYTAKKLSHIKFDSICSSPLKRASKTAEIINKYQNTRIIYSDALKERNFGRWDDMSYEEILGKYPEDIRLSEADWINYCIEGGESALQAYLRVTAFVRDLIHSHDEGKYLIVTHLGCIRNILAYLLEMGIEGSWRFRIDNCGITKVEVNDEKYAYISLLNG